MTSSGSDSEGFEALCRELLNQGLTVRFEARGASMSPIIRDLEIVYVTPVIVSKLRKGDIVLTKGHSGFRVHRLVVLDLDKNIFITRGDCGQQDDPPVRSDQILGIVLAKEVRLGEKIVVAKLKGIGGKLLQGAARGQRVASKLLRGTRGRRPSGDAGNKKANALLGTLGLIFVLLAAASSRAQVAVDTSPSTNTTAELTGAGTKTLTFNHTTSATANRALLVGVSMNITNSPTAAVTGVTYNGTALTLKGAHNDTGNTRRVEQWLLLNPASGINLAVVVSINIPASATIGVAAGATVFTDVDQTAPLGTFLSADGAAANNSQLDVPSVVNGMVFDTLAVGIGTVGVNGPQVQQWNVESGTTPAEDVVGTASSRTGAPSVPISENLNNTLNLTEVVPGGSVFTLTSVATGTIVLNITSAANNNGTTTVYTGTITGGVNNAYVGDTVIVAGFGNFRNNGTFTCTASTATTITLNNTRGVAQTNAATATANTTVYTGTITGGTANAYLGDVVAIAGFKTTANNGSFVALQSTATTITVNNFAGVAETDPATATVGKGTAGQAVYVGTITGGANNGYGGDSFTIAGFTNAGNNGTFTCNATTSTTLTCSNGAAVQETNNAGTASTNVTLNWSLGAISLNPSGADIGVTTTVGSAKFLGQATTFTTTVFNNGTSPAVGVSLTDTWPTSMTAVTITPSAGTTCSAAPPPITCTPPNPFASGATATVTVTTTAPTAGAYTDTATVTDTSPPDPNTGNNTYVAVATVQSVACAGVSQAAPGTNLTGTLNTYYPGTASVAAGAQSIPVGTPTGAGAAIATGNLLLVIQMQDASINDTNSVLYGNGSTGQGFTTLNSAGNYEFVTATGAISGGSVPISGAGSGGGLVFAYHASAASATAGQSTYQVIVVPQYTTASFNATTPPTALAWNGSTGGVLVLDTASTLTLNGATLSVDGLGFRGGAGLQLSGGAGGAVTDFLHAAPATYTGVLENGVDAPKGEGIAGTPLWVESGGTYLKTTTDYPSGTAGTDGSSARGAPGNAGGGGTDGDPPANDQNAGGGGGSNGGAGGFGGDSWNTNLSVGGEGGTVFPATINRVAMGGGGGAGTRNNSDGDTLASSGSAGGGIIIIRTYGLNGTATLSANGLNAYNGTSNDAGGGGGAGGSIVVLSANGGESGLTVSANGGNGGNAWASQAYSLGNRHGPGGGGGGGVLLISAAPASVSVGGGTNGLTLNPGVPYGSTPGAAGTTVTNASISQTSGTQSGAQCTPDMTLGKSHVGNFTRGLTASYTIPVSNLSPYGTTSGPVTVNDTLPLGLTPTSASGTGWSCGIASQTVSCVDSNVLAANSFYPSITINANVAPTAPSTVTNTALVSGGGEINLSNDSATDVATVVSVADLSVTNAASPDPVAAGGTITYTQIVTNNGPSAADNAALVEAGPANTTFLLIAAPAGWTCITPAVGATGNVVCTNPSMVGSTAATFTMLVKVNSGVANGTVITNTAAVSSSVSDPNSTNNTASASTIVGTTAQAEMTVTNSASPNPVLAGSDITYTQTATNVGAATATNPSITDTTPPNTTFVSISVPPGTTCTPLAVGASGSITCTAPAAPAGSSGTVQFVVQVAAGTASGTVITDTATVNSTNQAFGANSAIATDVVATSGQADLALSTVATPLTVYPGNDITYTQTVTNNGPAAATGVTFTEAIPANTTFASVAAPAGWSCTTTTSVTCTTTSLASGTSANISVVVSLASTVSAATITANSSVSSSGTTDPYSANNNTTVVTNVAAVCDLAVTNSGTPNPVAVGGTITYTQVVTNTGPSNCTTATLTEPYPNNTTFASLPSPTGWTCTTTSPISCTNPSVAPGSSTTFTLKMNVSAGSAPIVDTVTVASATHDTNLANNTATVTTGVSIAGDADLSISNSGSPNPVTAGNNITYTQTVINGGPAAATTVNLTETLPTGTTAVSLTGSAGWTCNLGTLTCTIGSLAANATASFTFVIGVSATATAGSTITQTGSVSSSTTDANPGNNSASASVAVAGFANLSISNTASPVPVQAGNNITYTQVLTNSGPSAAATATISEVTPPGTTFSSITFPAGWSCTYPTVGNTGTITCTNPSFVVGTASFSVVVTVSATATPGTAINDTATVTSATTDPNLANNSATAGDVVALTTQADLVTTNTAVPTTVAPGGNVTYTQTVTNNGPAAATTATFTQTTPPNTNFQLMTPPTGWTCTPLMAGATGTMTCTDGSNLALHASATFTFVLQVNAGTASGTNIAETVTASATNIVPNLTSNSATVTVVVANANSADMAIVKTGSPSPTVADGDLLTYTLTVTNNGPATATNVTVMDPLPSNVSNPVLSYTQGNCSAAENTVTCLLGSMTSGATATVTIVVLAGAPGMAVNTATVSADQADPNSANNTSTWPETITAATQIQLQFFSAQLSKEKNGANRVMLLWKTGGEAHNLGFNIYRDQAGERIQLNSSLVAGSALLMSGALPKHSGKTYSWIDWSAGAGGAYWLEDVDVNGTRTLHGPVTAEATASSRSSSEPTADTTLMLTQLSQVQPAAGFSEPSHPAENVLRNLRPTISQQQKQFELAAHPAVKIAVKHEGWYQVTQPELIKAGLDPNADPALLHLYAEAIEQPIQIMGASAGPGGFGPQAAIGFYGTGIDTPYTGTRIYWLATGDTPGQRIQQLPPSTGSNQPDASFPFTVEVTPHTTYFAALTSSNGHNFFGPLVSTTPVQQTMQVPHLDSSSIEPAMIEVTLQGIILAVPHDVTVALNGTTLGDLTFTGQVQGTFRTTLPPGLLQEGPNTVTLTSQSGEYDTSLIESIRIKYQHSYVADTNRLVFTGRAGDELRVTGFTSAPTVVLDITDPNQPVELTPQVISTTGSKTAGYALEVQVPWPTNNSSGSGQRTLLALTNDRVETPPGIRQNHPSHWHDPLPGSQIVMVSATSFTNALQPLVAAHEAAGQSTAVVSVDDLYDEFNFGEHSPGAIKNFLRTAVKAWHTAPQYLLLNGRASLDPRNYLGFGHLDIVPTKIVPTSSLMTASDDWFSDFNDSGMPTIATGRLPVSTPDEATLVANKVATYEGQSTNGPWTSQALMVADENDTENFTKDSQLVQAQLPSTLQVTDVFVTTTGITTARQDILAAINSGQLLVNYAGHGSEEQWSGSDLFDNSTATSLTNGSSLSVFLIMDCLNGFFQDVYEEPLAVTLMLAPNGGAVAVLASSSLNQAPPQTNLDKLVVQNAFSSPQPAMGDAILKAKSGITDIGVRKTFILFGDPSMQIKMPGRSPAH
jgi:uncharacterized repeat protein (TIGR01451 family)